jgi:hypothetical protein
MFAALRRSSSREGWKQNTALGVFLAEERVGDGHEDLAIHRGSFRGNRLH